jgi:ribonucleoside-diphosphate reductase subunit M2
MISSHLYTNMPLHNAAMYQAFREITNFIRNNGDEWDKFCTNTARMMTKTKKAPRPAEQLSKHKTAKNKGLLAPKLLLQENPQCFVLFPIHHADIWQMYKKNKTSFWTAEEIKLLADLVDWNRLSDTEHHFISHDLAFFAAFDGKARCFYGFQIAVENIHSTTYSLLIDTYIKDPKEKLHLLHTIETVPCAQRKANWALKWCNPTNASFAERMIAFAAVKGIFFSGSFCAICWLKKRGLMPGLSFSNELISHDEGLQCNFACLLYSKLINRLHEARIIDVINSAVDIEMEFLVDALPVELIGMNSIMKCNFIKFCGDQLLIALGCRRHYKIGNPFEWMEMISLQGKMIFSKNASENTQNPEWEWTEPTKLLPLTPASDLPTTHSYFISLPYIHGTHYFVPSWNINCPPPSPHLLLPRLYGKQYTRV